MGACVLCKEQITNPLGPQRLTEEMTTWLAESRPELITEFKEDATTFLNRKIFTPNDYCIIKGKPMNVCAYCFTEHVFHWLEEQQADAPLMKEYITFFDFDITKQGYVKEYEEKYVQES